MRRKQSKTSTDLSLTLSDHLICCKLTSIPCLPIVENRYQRLIRPNFPVISLMLIKPRGVPGQKRIYSPGPGKHYLTHDQLSGYLVEPCSHNMLTAHNDLQPHPLFYAHLIWPYLLQNHMLPRYAYHPLALDKYPPFHIYDVTPTCHLVDHYLSHENWSLPEMDSLGEDRISPSHL